MKSFLAAAFALTLFLPVAARSQDTPVVVELFTSQGCSSCPPADALMAELSERDDVIALALHVDYWDYIGWKDSLAQPAHTERQKSYAYKSGRRMVYTPQIIVNGTDELVGAKSMKLAELIMRHRAAPAQARITADPLGQGARLRIERAADLPPGLLDVIVVHYLPATVVDITRGENAGRTITYKNAVRDWHVLGQWDGVEPVEFEAALNGDLPAVAIVQHRGRKGPGAIVAAARLN
jgi:hypothetical protein